MCDNNSILFYNFFFVWNDLVEHCFFNLLLFNLYIIYNKKITFEIMGD